MSAYLEKAAQRQIERDDLDELIAGSDEANGPADPVAAAAKGAALTDTPLLRPRTGAPARVGR